MFDVGFTEVFLIGVVSLIVIGPERLPTVAKTVGQYVGKLQRFVRGVRTDIAQEFETGDLKKLIGDQKEQIDELRQMVSSTRQDLQSTAQSVVQSTREGLSELEQTVEKARADEPGSDQSQPASPNTSVSLPTSSANLSKSAQQPAVSPSPGSDAASGESASHDNN